MGTTYDIPGIGMLKLGELESAVSRMGSSAIRTILERGGLPDPVTAVLKDELTRRGKKDGGFIEKPLGAGGKK